MSEPIELKNAVIEKAYFDNERGLSAWLQLDYGGCGQGFGGFMLYGPKGWACHGGANYAGHFIYRCLEIGGASDWSKLVGKTIRVKASHSKVIAIGHIVKDDWFEPSKDFEEMSKANP
jgi:hypothetical protein